MSDILLLDSEFNGGTGVHNVARGHDENRRERDNHKKWEKIGEWEESITVIFSLSLSLVSSVVTASKCEFIESIH